MELNFITEYAVPIIVGICLCMGYMLKHVVKTDVVNKYIPAIMGVLGVMLNVWMNMSFTPEILFAGLISGLSSTGMHQAFTKIINKDNEE